MFAAPLFAAVMTSELSPTPKRAYVAAFVPQFIAATVGFVIYFGITGTQILETFEVAGYAFEVWHLIVAIPLGLISALLLVGYVALRRAVAQISKPHLPNPYLKALLLGSIIGAISFAVPLMATGGSPQLVYEIDNAAALSIGLLTLVLAAKMVAVACLLAAVPGAIIAPIGIAVITAYITVSALRLHLAKRDM